MTRDYGQPDRAEANRALIEERLAEAAGSGSRETLTVEWRGQPAHLDVIKVPVGILYYNPATHRVRAQRSHNPDQDALLEKDPWSQQGQGYLDYLLKMLPSDPAKQDPDFDKLADSLKEYGQNEPGLVTREGVLVNGNTRRAALLGLFGSPYMMRVAVLPASCTWEDIGNIELSLQLRKEHKRDYSYINHLLALEERIAQGEQLAAIAATFRVARKTCERDQWVLSVIRSMIQRSEVSGVKLPLVAFEDKAEKFNELHRGYMAEQAVHPERAEIFLESRLAAIMQEFSKTDVRWIEPGFDERYLAPELPMTLVRASEASGATVIPGLGRAVRGPSDSLAKARAVTNAVLQAKAAEKYGTSLPDDVRNDAVATASVLREAMETAISKAGRDSRVRKRKQAAPVRLGDASLSIEQCVTDLVMSRASRSLDEEQFDMALLALRQSLEKLALEAHRTVEAPGEGTTWLLGMLGKKP